MDLIGRCEDASLHATLQIQVFGRILFENAVIFPYWSEGRENSDE